MTYDFPQEQLAVFGRQVDDERLGVAIALLDLSQRAVRVAGVRHAVDVALHRQTVQRHRLQELL